MPRMSFPIVNKLGGPEAVCEMLGITLNALRMQAARGSMPGKHMRKLMQEAKARRIATDLADFVPSPAEAA